MTDRNNTLDTPVQTGPRSSVDDSSTRASSPSPSPSSPSSPSAPASASAPPSPPQRLVSLVGWIPIVVMLAFPSFMGYAGALGLSLGISVSLQAFYCYQHRIGKIKVWPKLLDVTMLLISFSLLIVELTTHPSQDFHHFYFSAIVNGGLFVVAVFSMAIGKPFTMQMAMEVIPQERWKDPKFVAVNQKTTLIWVGVFFLSTLFPLIPVMANRKEGTFSTIFATILPIVTLIGGFKITDVYVKHVKKQAKMLQEANADNDNGIV